MSNSHNVRDLSPEAKHAVEALLGRALNVDEQISILAYRLHEPRSPEDKDAALRRLREYWARVDEKTKDVPDEEMDEILDEVMRSVRPRYERIR